MTPRTAAAATAASTALPPLRSVSTAACVASMSTVAAAPPVPIDVGGPREPASAQAPTCAANAATATTRRMTSERTGTTAHHFPSPGCRATSTPRPPTETHTQYHAPMRIRIGCSFVHDATSPTPAVVLAEPHGELARTGRRGALDERARSLLLDLHRPLRQPLPPARAPGRGLDGQLRRPRRDRPGARADAGPGRPAAPDRGPPRPAAALAPAEPLRRVRPALRHGLGALRQDRAAAPSACSRSRAGSTRTSSTASPASRRPRPSRSSSGEAGSAATWRTSASRSAARSASPPATRAATCPTSASRARIPPMDFHAWFEVWLGERWWALDGRYNMPRIGRVPIGRGRDAADVAMITTYGDATLTADGRVGRRVRPRRCCPMVDDALTT